MLAALFCLKVVAAEPKPFDKVMVFSGGSHQTASFLGMVEQAREMGWDPDVVISTCGSSVANQILNVSDDPKEWHRIVSSREFYEMLRREKINEKAAQGVNVIGTIGANAAENFMREAQNTEPVSRVPDIFANNYLIHTPTSGFPKTFDVPFSRKGIRSIMVAARADIKPSDVGKKRNGRKLLTELFFTDPDTAQYLKGFKSPVARAFPASNIADDTAIMTDQSLAVAMRASISEPTLMNLMSIGKGDDRTYLMAGSVDSYPIELAKTLGDHVIATRIGYISDLETMIGENVHGFNMNERRRQVQRQQVDHWIDRTNTDDIDDLEPKKNFTFTSGKLLHLSSGIPDSYEEYKKIVDKHWKWGRDRMKETLETPRNSIDHIRKESSDGVKDGLFHKSGKVGGTLWAPAMSLSGIYSRMEEEDDTVADATFEMLVNQGWPLGIYVGGSVILDLVRRHFLQSHPSLIPAEPNQRVLRIVSYPGLNEKDDGVKDVLRVSSFKELTDYLRRSDSNAPYDRIEFVARSKKKGKILWADGTLLTDKQLAALAEVPRVGVPNAEIILAVSRMGRYQEGRDQAAQLAAALASHPRVTLTARDIRWPKSTATHVAGFVAGHLSGLTNLRTTYSTLRALPSAHRMAKGYESLPCAGSLPRLVD